MCSKSENCIAVWITIYFTYTVPSTLDVSAAASHVPTWATAESALLVSLCLPCSTPRPWLVCSTEWKPLNSVSPSESYPSWVPYPLIQGGKCQVLHRQGSDHGLCHSKGRKGRSTAGNEWVVFNPARSLLSTCGAVSHNWVVNPTGSWKSRIFLFQKWLLVCSQIPLSNSSRYAVRLSGFQPIHMWSLLESFNHNFPSLYR